VRGCWKKKEENNNSRKKENQIFRNLERQVGSARNRQVIYVVEEQLGTFGKQLGGADNPPENSWKTV
jgi:hypothetical protein